jgi:ribonuclease P protein component
MAARSSRPELPPESSAQRLKVDRLRHRPDFLRCARGFRRVTLSLTLEVVPTPEKYAGPPRARVGFTATKKLGGAVERNRAKRRLRAAAAALLPLYGLEGTDYVLVARAGTLVRPFAQILEDLAASLNAAREKLARWEEF